ncbi:hypothetical protein FACS1894217_09750 [Clostridia bacterium]|nr:hypothetical protein FACS1894217_09750 [Clostridia bacterium]
MKKIILFLILALAISVPAALAADAPAAPVNVKVSFSAGGGKPVPAAQTVAAGETLTAPADPERVGYEFLGWYVDAKKTVKYNFGAPVNGRLTLYAGWAKLPAVTYAAGGGKPVPKREYITPGQTGIDLPIITRTGYEFRGWYVDAKKTVKYTGGVGTSNGLKLYAGWEKLPTVMFNAKGGKPAPAKQSLNFGDTADKPADPTKTGSIFKGWYTDPLLKNEFNFAEPIEKSLKLYARWEVLPAVSFSVSGAKPAPAKQSILPGETVAAPTGLVKTGYSFGGWYTSPRFTETFDFSKPITDKRVTVYAKWVRDPVVTFFTKGKTANPPKVTLRAGEKVDEPQLGDPFGYRLEGWYTDSACKKKFNFDTPVTAKLSLYANWVKV